MATLPAANTLEGGSDETTITTGNSGGGSGTAFDLVTISSGHTLVYDSAVAAHGGLSARIDIPATTGNVVQVGWNWTGVGEAWGRMYVYRTGNWTGPSTLRLIGFEDDSPSAIGRINLVRSDFGSYLQLLDKDFAHQADTSGGLTSLSTWYRIEWRVLASATVGEIEAKIFLGDETTPISGGTAQTTAGANTGSNIGRVTYGNNSSWGSASAFSLWLDSMQANSTGFPGPLLTADPATLRVVASPLRW